MLDLRTARERLNAAHTYLYRGLIGPVREGLTEGIPAHVEHELEHGLDASLSTAQDLLGDADATRSAVGGEIELIEVRNASPSVRLARWEDGHPERYTSTDKVGGFWRAIAWDEDGDFTRGTGGTRDEARAALSAALDKAGAGATTEGEQHGA